MKRTKFKLSHARLGVPMVTRDGRPAVFVAYEPRARYECTVIALIMIPGDTVGEIELFDDTGRYMPQGKSDMDLFMKGTV